MNFKKRLVLTGLFLLPTFARGQAGNDAVVEQIVESVMEDLGEDVDFTELTERLEFHRRHPINLNIASKEQLQQLLFLSPLQINQFMTHRWENGRLLDLYELQSIDSFDPETIQRLLPFVTLGSENPFDNIDLKSFLKSGRHDIMITVGQTLQKPSGYSQSGNTNFYLGSQQRLLTRYRYHFDPHFSAAITMEKDPGEAFFSAQQPHGFDFYSANIFYRGEGIFKKLVLGDYSLQFGQGIGLWTGLSFGKGASISTITKNDVGLKPYTSTNETLFLRGISATLRISDNIQITPFFSYRNLDANLESYDKMDVVASSMSQSGLHRTASELDHRNSITQILYGTSADYSRKQLKIGTVFYRTGFNYPILNEEKNFNSAAFSGNQLLNGSIYYSNNWRNLYFFGESGHSIGSGWAFLNGAICSLTPSVSMVVLQRNYHTDYNSFFSQPVTEGTSASNEKGFYSGIEFSPSRKYQISAYADVFHFPWLRFRTDAPSSGYELLSQFTYSPSKTLKTTFRYKLERKQQNDELNNSLNYLEDVIKRSFRLEMSCKIGGDFEARSRAEMVLWNKDQKTENGFLLYQDIIYKPLHSCLSGNIRFAVFETDGFNSRIYAFENDVLYGFSAPAYQNKGLRFYLNTRIKLQRKTDLWLRYAVTSYSNVHEIGSGLDKIQGNNKSDVKLQLRFQF